MQGKYPNDIGDWEVALSTVKVVDTALVSTSQMQYHADYKETDQKDQCFL